MCAEYRLSIIISLNKNLKQENISSKRKSSGSPNSVIQLNQTRHGEMGGRIIRE